jgi:hypothetical protein
LKQLNTHETANDCPIARPFFALFEKYPAKCDFCLGGLYAHITPSVERQQKNSLFPFPQVEIYASRHTTVRMDRGQAKACPFVRWNQREMQHVERGKPEAWREGTAFRSPWAKVSASAPANPASNAVSYAHSQSSNASSAVIRDL